MTRLLQRIAAFFKPADPVHVKIAKQRARAVWVEIIYLREALANGHQKGALLATYDAELARLATVPGVMEELLTDRIA